MTFAAPVWLAAAVALAVAFAVFAVRGTRASRAAALDYSNLAFLERAVGRGFPWTSLFTTAWALAIVLAGAALARPSVVA